MTSASSYARAPMARSAAEQRRVKIIPNRRGVLEELVPSAWHHVEQHANNPVEADHGQLKRRLRPMRGLQTDRTAQVVISGHAFVQNVRRGLYERGVDAHPMQRLAAAFGEVAGAI